MDKNGLWCRWTMTSNIMYVVMMLFDAMLCPSNLAPIGVDVYV